MSYNVSKYQQFLRKFTFGILKFKFQNGLKQKKIQVMAIVETNQPVEAKPPKKSVEILLQILKPLSNTKILTPELVNT